MSGTSVSASRACNRLGLFTMTLRYRALLSLSICVVTWPAAVWATPPDDEKDSDEQVAALQKPAEGSDTGTAPAAATVDKIMAQAVRNIAARYNLNEAQTELTHRLMKREVYRFLKDHENEVWPVIRDLLATQIGANPPDDLQQMKRIGQSARPLLDYAKESIFKANEEWRLILTPEQIRTHDFDLAEMRTTFDKIDENFEQWEDGNPVAGGLFPEPQLKGDPPRPRQPKDEGGQVAVFDPKPILETLVEEFIKEYKLDEGQITAAQSILEEFKSKADDLRSSKKVEFAMVAAQQRAALETRDLKALKLASTEHKKLLVPVYKLCDLMEERLKGLLTSAQIQQHAEKSARGKKRPTPDRVTRKTTPKKEPPQDAEAAKPKAPQSSDNG